MSRAKPGRLTKIRFRSLRQRVIVGEQDRFLWGEFQMRILTVPLCGIGLALAVCGVQPLAAQEASETAAAAPAAQVEPSAPAVEPPAPAPAVEPAAPSAGPAVDPSTIPLPDLAFQPDEEAIRNYVKYFYFHRENNDFATAHSDLLECDAYARGFASLPYMNTPYPYAGTLGGAIGGAIGNAMADAIWGSAQRRQLRRINMRTCMTFKGYRVYGLPKSLWEEFNFEEGLNSVEESRRAQLLRVQARVASGPTPQVGEMVE